MPISMQLSPDGIAFIQKQEGLQLTAYRDANGHSIGYGHFITGKEAAIIGVNLDQNSAITVEQAGELLMHDVKWAVDAVNRNVDVPLTQGQFDALVDFVYNVGETNFRNSTLLRELNAMNYDGAKAQFASWNISQGKVNQSLVARRQAETAIFV